MSRVVVAARTTGARTIAGTDWPIVDQLVREQLPGRQATWVAVRGLCNGVPDHASEHATRRAALVALGYASGELGDAVADGALALPDTLAQGTGLFDLDDA